MIKIIRKVATFRPVIVEMMGQTALERDTVLDMIAGTDVRVVGARYEWAARANGRQRYCDLSVWLWIES